MKTDPEDALVKARGLMEQGWYSEDLYERMAKILRKMKKYDEEIDLILQMKCDFGYTHLDERLCDLLRRREQYR